MLSKINLFIFFFIFCINLFFPDTLFAATIEQRLRHIEHTKDGRIGVYAYNTGNQQLISHRSYERFPMGCTSKVIGVAAILDKAQNNPSLLFKKVKFHSDALVSWSPVTSKHVKEGMTIYDLCAAAIRYSDNTAMNLLAHELGGLEIINRYARKLGDKNFRQDNFWPDEAFSGGEDQYDSNTPASMGQDLIQLFLKKRLANQKLELLQVWMLGNTTGNKRIRAGVPKTWKVADKTGTGTYYGSTNDIGIIWPKHCAPIIMVVFFTHFQKDAQVNDKVVADVTQTVIQEMAKQDPCLEHALVT